MTIAEWWLTGGGVELLGTFVCARNLYDGKRATFRDWEEWEPGKVFLAFGIGLFWAPALVFIVFMALIAWHPKGDE